jgi:hypothetical protein
MMNNELQINDLNTLMYLDGMADDNNLDPESNNAFVPKERYSEIQKDKMLIERKPDYNLICSRCHNLKNQNKLIDYKSPFD